jgi:polysaccharide export outer membrane protein
MIIHIMSIIKFGEGKRPSFLPFISLITISCLVLFSCSAPKNITYFRDIPDTISKRTITQVGYNSLLIKPDDILQVSIQTLDPVSTGMLNQESANPLPAIGNANQPVSSASSAVTGYLVDKNGEIILPLVGKVDVKGKSTAEVRDIIQTKAAEFYKDPVVSVRFANFKITVLGEVARPSTYVMPNEKVSVLDALGMAGDLTIFGKRENVLLIREGMSDKEFVRLNLNDSKLFSSPYYYLQQGDVIYVEPNKSKIAATDVSQVKKISIITGILTLLVVIASRIK